jgi:hypothetical protein
LNVLIDQVAARTIDPYSAADQLQRAAVQA